MAEPGNLQSLNDEQLAEQAQNGCLQSFAELVRRYQVPILHFLRRKCGSAVEAEDLTQETFLRIFRKLDHYRRGAQFRPWAFTVAYRVALNDMRRRRPANNLFEEQKVCVPASSFNPGGDGTKEQVWDAVQAKLNSVQFTAIWLFYVEDLTVKQIAKVLGKSETAVKTILCRARKSVADVLRPFAEEYGLNLAPAEADQEASQGEVFPNGREPSTLPPVEEPPEAALEGKIERAIASCNE